MRDVVWVEPNDSGLRLVSLMGESRLLQARIISIDLLNSSIVLQRTAAEPRQSVSADHKAEKQVDLSGISGAESDSAGI